MAIAHKPRLELRRMEVQDLEPVMEILRASFQHPWSPELLRRELDHDWSTILLAVDPEGRIAGFIIFWVVHDEVHILNVATAPESRRKGVARLLLQETEKRAAAGKAALITLEVRKSNHAAIELYRNFGYRSVGIRPNYYVDEQEDAIVMLKDLQ